MNIVYIETTNFRIQNELWTRELAALETYLSIFCAMYEIVVFFVLWTQPGMDEMKRTSENLVCEQFYYLGRRDIVRHGVGSIPSD